MTSAFDAEFQSVAIPEIKTAFGETCTYTPRDQSCEPYSLTVIFDAPRSLAFDENPGVKVETRRMEALIEIGDLQDTPVHGDRITRESDQVFKVVSDTADSATEWDDSGSAMLRIQLVEMREPTDPEQ